MFTKGGMTGLPESDFYKRQKSGDWSIDEHFEDVNYIRTRSFTPNNYLNIGHYETDKVLIYDIFNNQVSSLTKSITGTDLPSISCVAYNKTIGHLAIGMNKAPYLRVFDTSINDMTDFVMSDKYLLSSEIVPHPVFIQRFRERNLDGNTLHVVHNFNDPLPATMMIAIGPNVSYPYEIEVIDENQIDIIFHEWSENLSGIIYIHSYGGNSVYLLDVLTPTISGNYTSYRLVLTDGEHNNPNFQVYNSLNRMIFPAYIREIQTNSVYDFIFPTSFDISDVRILVVQGYESHTDSFTVTSDQTPVLIYHPLLSRYVSIQIFDESTGLVVYPSNINIQDKSNILISTDNFIPTRTYKINISASPPNYEIPEFLIGEPPNSMVTCLEFDNVGDTLFVGTLEPDVRDSNILEFNTDDYIRSVYLDPLPTVPTDIKFDLDDNYLFIGHYSTSLTSVASGSSESIIDRNCTLYDYQTKEIVNDYDFSTLKNLTSDSVTCACFITDQRLLALGSYYEPYLHFYNYIKKENVTDKYTSLISNNVISRVVDLIKTKDDQYLLIALDNFPYLVVLDLVNKEIHNLVSNLIVSSITSISLSINDTYLCVTQREDPYVTVFEFSTNTITPIILNYTLTTTPLTSTFFFGPISSET